MSDRVRKGREQKRKMIENVPEKANTKIDEGCKKSRQKSGGKTRHNEGGREQAKRVRKKRR